MTEALVSSIGNTIAGLTAELFQIIVRGLSIVSIYKTVLDHMMSFGWHKASDEVILCSLKGINYFCFCNGNKTSIQY